MIITRGISASGKTTFAKELCEKDESYLDINRDWIRFNVVAPGTDWSTYKFTNKREREVTEIQKEMVMDAFGKEKNVIISDTNLNESTMNMWVDIADDLGYDVTVLDFSVTYEEAIKRDRLRPNSVGHTVIYKQYVNWLKLTEQVVPVEQKSTFAPKAIIYDIDGTLAFNNGDRGWYEWMRVAEDDVNEFLADILRNKYDDYITIIVSGRDEVCREVTSHWLASNHIPHDYLYMRKEGDQRKDSIVKMEIFNEHIRDSFDVVAVFDDRPQVLRDCWIPLGLQTYTVGNWMEEF